MTLPVSSSLTSKQWDMERLRTLIARRGGIDALLGMVVSAGATASLVALKQSKQFKDVQHMREKNQMARKEQKDRQQWDKDIAMLDMRQSKNKRLAEALQKEAAVENQVRQERSSIAQLEESRSQNRFALLEAARAREACLLAELQDASSEVSAILAFIQE